MRRPCVAAARSRDLRLLWRYCEWRFRAGVALVLLVSCPLVAGAEDVTFCPVPVEPAADVAALHELGAPPVGADPLPFHVVVGAPGVDPFAPPGGTPP